MQPDFDALPLLHTTTHTWPYPRAPPPIPPGRIDFVQRRAREYHDMLEKEVVVEDPFDLIWYEGARVDFMVKQAVAGARANLIEEVADMVADSRYKIDAKDNEVSATVRLNCLNCLNGLNGLCWWPHQTARTGRHCADCCDWGWKPESDAPAAATTCRPQCC